MVNDKTYLVYQLGTVESGTGGRSSYYFYAIAFGNTEEDVVKSWAENVEKIYGVKLVPKFENGVWNSYHRIVWNELPVSLYGNTPMLNITNKQGE